MHMVIACPKFATHFCLLPFVSVWMIFVKALGLQKSCHIVAQKVDPRLQESGNVVTRDRPVGLACVFKALDELDGGGHARVLGQAEQVRDLAWQQDGRFRVGNQRRWLRRVRPAPVDRQDRALFNDVGLEPFDIVVSLPSQLRRIPTAQVVGRGGCRQEALDTCFIPSVLEPDAGARGKRRVGDQAIIALLIPRGSWTFPLATRQKNPASTSRMPTGAGGS